MRLAKLKMLIAMLSAASVLLFALPVSAFAADTISLTLNGIQGSSKTAGPGAIDISSFSFGAANQAQQAAGTGSKGGKTQYSEISITKNTDKSSLPILLRLATGKQIADGTLLFRKDQDGKPITYLKIILKNISITSYSIGGASGEGSPSESITFSAQQIDFEYTDIKQDGTAGATDKLSIDQAKNIVK